MRTVLALSPHADDTELGLGGYLNSLRRKGEDVHIEIGLMASGDSSSSKTTHDAGRRLQEALAAASLVEAEVKFLNAAPDGAFTSVWPRQLVTAIEDFLFYRNDAPDELFIPLPSFHSDHTATYEAAIAALRPRMSRQLPRRIYAYEYPSNHWGPQVPALGKVYRTLDTEDVNVKLAMLACYSSQWVSNDEAPGLGGHAVTALAELRGSEVAAEWAELFYLVRSID